MRCEFSHDMIMIAMNYLIYLMVMQCFGDESILSIDIYAY